MEVTRGNVWVAGYDMTTQTQLGRAHIGLCPQHNVLFNELTVREHLEFFARLKGYSGQQLDDDIDKLIDSLEMQEKVRCLFLNNCHKNVIRESDMVDQKIYDFGLNILYSKFYV